MHRPANIGPKPPKFPQIWPNFVNVMPHLAEFGPHSVHAAPNLVESDRIRSEFYRVWFVFHLILADPGGARPDFGRPNIARVLPFVDQICLRPDLRHPDYITLPHIPGSSSASNIV